MIAKSNALGPVITHFDVDVGWAVTVGRRGQAVLSGSGLEESAFSFWEARPATSNETLATALRRNALSLAHGHTAACLRSDRKSIHREDTTHHYPGNTNDGA